MVAQPVPTPVAPALRSFADACERLREGAAREHRVRPTDVRVLSRLVAAGRGLRPVELAAQAGVSSGTLTAVLDRLQRAGLLERRPHPTDRRSAIVELTGRGTRLVADFDAELAGAAAAAAPEQLALTARTLRLLTDHLERPDTPAARAARIRPVSSR